MKILIVEDDHFQAESVTLALRARWRDVDVERCSTESEFRGMLPQIVAHPPAVIILDVMLRWADPSPEIPQRPDDVKAEGVYKAGFRCQKLLAGNGRTRDIPIVLYTVLEGSDLAEKLSELPPTVKYVHKESDCRDLVDEIAAHIN